MTRRLLAVVALACLLGAPRARAADEGAGPDTVSVAVFLVMDTPVSRKAQAALMRGMETALKRNDRLDVKDKDLLLAEFGGEIPEEQVAKARDLATEGLQLLESGDPAGAIEKLTAAEAALEPVLAFVKKNELADTQFLLGAAHAAAGDKKKARATFVRLQAWRPNHQWDVERWSHLVPLWEAAKEEVKKSGRGSLEVNSEPDGAMAFVDGKYVGVTPAAVDGLPVGDHYVTLKLEGYQRKVVKAHVDARYQELVTESLPRSEKYLLIEQSLERARAKLGEDEADVAMLDLRTFLFIDMAVFVRVEPGKSKRTLRVTAYLYDLRSKQRLSEVKGADVDVDKPAELDDKMGEVANALFASVKYDGKRPDLKPRKRKGKPGEEKPAFYTRWWFWTGIVVAASVAGGVVFYDDLVPAPPPSCAGGTLCGEVITNF